MLLETGDRAGALKVYQEGLAIRRALAAVNAAGPRGGMDLVASLLKVSTASALDGARAALREALALLEDLRMRGKLAAEQHRWPELVRETLAGLEDAEDRSATPAASP